MLVPIMVLHVELMVPVVLLSDVVFVTWLVSRVNVDVELLVPVVVLRV